MVRTKNCVVKYVRSFVPILALNNRRERIGPVLTKYQLEKFKTIYQILISL